MSSKPKKANARAAGSRTKNASRKPIRAVRANPLANEPLFSLKLLREAHGQTRVTLAHGADMDDAEVSELEGKKRLDTVDVGTLRKYAKALGGKVEIVVRIDGRRYVLRG
jgi:hypothetical protein